MKRLFNDNKDERYNDVGRQIDVEIAQALRPIFERWHKEGYSVRDIQQVAFMAAVDVGLDGLLWPQYEIKENDE